jgi:hypothetical protein
MRKSTTGVLALVLLGAPLTGIHPGSASTARCFGKAATIANSADEVPGSNSADVILGGTGPTFVYGYAGRDRICDHGEHDDIWGGPGDDLIAAGAGWDTVDGGDGLPLLPSGDDLIYGGPGRDLLTGGDGADRLYGGAGNDSLAGGPGNDILDGGAGDDVLIGGRGHDAFHGGPGHDTCYVTARTHRVRSCEAIRTRQPRLGSASAVPGVVHRPSATRLRPCVHGTLLGGRVKANQAAARVQERRCWCRTRPPRTRAAGHETAAPAAQVDPRPAPLLRTSVDGCRWTPRTYGYSTPGTTVPPGR